MRTATLWPQPATPDLTSCILVLCPPVCSLGVLAGANVRPQVAQHSRQGERFRVTQPQSHLAACPLRGVLILTLLWPACVCGVYCLQMQSLYSFMDESHLSRPTKCVLLWNNHASSDISMCSFSLSSLLLFPECVLQAGVDQVHARALAARSLHVSAACFRRLALRTLAIVRVCCGF